MLCAAAADLSGQSPRKRPKNPLEATRQAVHDAQPPPLPQVYSADLENRGHNRGVPLSDRERRRRARIERQQKAAMKMCLRMDKPFSTRYLDYRYWQCLSCGWNPEDELIYDWFRTLQWLVREYLVCVSRDLRRTGHQNRWKLTKQA
jgi:hypothetical protein